MRTPPQGLILTGFAFLSSTNCRSDNVATAPGRALVVPSFEITGDPGRDQLR